MSKPRYKVLSKTGFYFSLYPSVSVPRAKGWELQSFSFETGKGSRLISQLVALKKDDICLGFDSTRLG